MSKMCGKVFDTLASILYEGGREVGRKETEDILISVLTRTVREMGGDRQRVENILVSEYRLDEKEAKAKVKMYW